MNKPLCLGALALALTAGGCDKKLIGSHLKELINPMITENGVTDAEITCPDMPIKKGAVGTCTVKAEGVSFEVEVTQKDDAGSVNAQLKGVLFPAHYASRMQAKMREKTPSATVDCGGKVKAVHAGDKIPCLITVDGDKATFDLVVKDDYGNAMGGPATAVEGAKPSEPPAAPDEPKPEPAAQ